MLVIASCFVKPSWLPTLTSPLTRKQPFYNHPYLTANQTNYEMADWPERDVEKIAKGWSIAMSYSKERIKRIFDLEDDQMEDAINEGRVVLETVCLFMHACVKHGQYK